MILKRSGWTRRVPALTSAAVMLAAASLWAAAVLPARAADYGPGAVSAGGALMPVLAISPGEGAAVRRLDLTIGRSLVVELSRDAKEIFVANPQVANAVVRSTRKLFVIGVGNGATSIVVMDNEGRQIAALDVTVGRDLNVLRQTLRTVLPNAQIEIKPAGDSIVMIGFVNSASEAQQAADIANAFVGQTTSGGGSASSQGGGTSISIGNSSTVTGKIINALTIKGRDQVMLKVTVVEVARNVLKQFGISTNAGWNTPGLFPPRPLDPVTGALTDRFLNDTGFPVSGFQGGNNLLTGTLNKGGFSLSATLRAFERAGVSRILAEPTLTAISGESAKFLVGGQVPIPIQNCPVGQAVCTVSVDYKNFGVILNFTPVVLSEGRISLRVGTEVSEIDTNVSVTFGGLNIPGFRVRRSETTVELPSGAVMMTAGLIQQTSRQVIEGLPGMLNLPILGTLFRSRDYQRQETELMIMVTPYIAQPMAAAQVKRPDDGFVDASDAQTILLGRLNRLYGVAGAPPLKPTSKSRFGFITD